MHCHRLLTILLIAAGAFAQPTPTAVTDAASFTNRVSPGSLATLFGSNIAVMNANASTLPLPFSLGNVQITVDGYDAPIIFTGITPYPQVNFQMPVEVQPGTANLVVTVNGVSSAPLPVTITDTAPGIFTYDPTGGTLDPTLLQAVIQNPPDYNNSNINSPSNPAPAGSVVVVYIDGTGAVRTPLDDGVAADGSDPAKAVSTATIGGFDAPVQYLGLTPGDVGLAQANIQIPAGLPSGDYPLVITVGGLQSISAIISVSGDGTLPTFLNEVSLFNDFAVSERTTLQVLQSTVYLCGAERIRVFDARDPGTPSFVGEYGDSALNGREISCAVNNMVTNPYLVSVVGPENDPTITVFDVSGNNLQSPEPIVQGVSAQGYTGLQKFVFDGNIGFVNTSYIDSTGNHSDLLAFDFTDPSQPKLISANSADQLLPFIRVASVPHTLFGVTGTATGVEVGGTGALDVFDTTDPTKVGLISEVKAPGTAILQSFAATPNTLVAAGNTSDDGQYISPNVLFPGNLTISTFDVSNPTNPSFIATLDTGIQSTGSLRTIAFDPSGVFLVEYQYPSTDINGPTSLAVVDARDPSKPLFYPQATYYYFDGLTTIKGYVYAASGNGLNIYQSLVQ